MEKQAQVSHISSLLGYKSTSRYVARANFIFDGLTLQGKRVLEIGCGKGGLLAWAALQGAAFVLGLEPEQAGSFSGNYNTLQKVVSTLSIDTVKISRARLDEFSFSETFDVVILYNVINHLDERAVVDLHLNPASYHTFLKIAEKLRSVTAPKGVLILADAARSNLWGDLGSKSPFARTIEWGKHQNPSVWKRLFEQTGFRMLDLRWSYLYPLGKWSSNFLLHYVTLSHFIMRFILDDRCTSGNLTSNRDIGN
jgi:SAM-dependent methyltransferase